MAKKLTLQLAVRLAPDIRKAFIKKAHAFGGTSEVLRELVHAFAEDRITITPPPVKEIFK